MLPMHPTGLVPDGTSRASVGTRPGSWAFPSAGGGPVGCCRLSRGHLARQGGGWLPHESLAEEHEPSHFVLQFVLQFAHDPMATCSKARPRFKSFHKPLPTHMKATPRETDGVHVGNGFLCDLSGLSCRPYSIRSTNII